MVSETDTNFDLSTLVSLANNTKYLKRLGVKWYSGWQISFNFHCHYNQEI